MEAVSSLGMVFWVYSLACKRKALPAAVVSLRGCVATAVLLLLLLLTLKIKSLVSH